MRWWKNSFHSFFLPPAPYHSSTLPYLFNQECKIPQTRFTQKKSILKCPSFLSQVLEFVDNHGNEVLSLGSFAILPEHVVRLILSREQLKAEELVKFNAVYNWAQRYVEIAPATCDLREIMANFYDTIEFSQIPATILMREVHPLGVVPDNLIMNALAFQVSVFTL